MPGEAFGINGDKAEDFNLDDWITGARLPEKSVTVYGRADLVADIHELERDLETVRAARDERLPGPGQPPQAIAAEIEAKRTQMEASALTFRFRALLSTEAIAAEEKAQRKLTDDEVGYIHLSKQCIHPEVTSAQWAQIRAKIGEGQFQAILEAAGSASYDRRVSVPFSLAASALLANEGS
jgi:hypothetical protein